MEEGLLEFRRCLRANDISDIEVLFWYASLMSRLIIVIFVLLPLLAKAEDPGATVSASFQDVCKKMEQAGIVGRPQTDLVEKAIPENILVIIGSDSQRGSGQTAPISNSEIIVGANMASISTYTSASTSIASPSADPCKPMINGQSKVSERAILEPPDISEH